MSWNKVLRVFLSTPAYLGKSGWDTLILDGQIQTIRSVINPDKLGHVGPVADAWAVVREAQQARRPTD